jgi:Mg-chelatase subunit ChlD
VLSDRRGAHPAHQEVAMSEPTEAITQPERVHIWFLIDRSGSMSPLRSAVVDGFREFVSGQRAKVAESDALLTLVQFDGDDPYDPLLEACPLAEVPDDAADGFAPRGMTPLYDALGDLISTAEDRQLHLVADGEAPEDEIIVVFTDGAENASTRWSQRQVLDRIAKRRADGWTFVFLGANQDSYGVARDLGLAHGSTSNYQASSSGTLGAFASVSRSASSYLSKPSKSARRAQKDDFFEGVKEAEDDSDDGSGES